jgi:N-acetylmuramoyl-L-alanine amidase
LDQRLEANPLITLLLLIIFLLTGMSGPSGQSTPQLGPSESSRGALAGKVIVIDPGHGGPDPGAVGISGRTLEKYNVVWIARDLKALLEKEGAKVIMTRDGDNYLTLDARVRLANQRGADIFVSIHNDANLNRQIRGTTTYYYTAGSKPLAAAVQRELVRALGSNDIGVRQAPFYVIRKTWMPSVLVEVGFVTNPAEEKLLVDPSYRLRAARGIYNGIVTYFTSKSAATR